MNNVPVGRSLEVGFLNDSTARMVLAAAGGSWYMMYSRYALVNVQ
jgi:hypothetical protein